MRGQDCGSGQWLGHRGNPELGASQHRRSANLGNARRRKAGGGIASCDSRNDAGHLAVAHGTLDNIF